MQIENFKFIDLFAGIGGFHLAMHSIGGECVFASEIDPFARKTYEHNFKDISPELFKSKMFNDDIRKITPEELPDFDILCAGFPCQPFSQAGHKRGFNDTHKSERGNLFFNIVDILTAKRPKAFFLENVRGILNHDNGNTFNVIRDCLENELGYSFYYKVVKASDYGLPQLRPRTFMIGFKNEKFLKEFTFPKEIPLKFTMSDVWGAKCERDIGFTLRVGGRSSSIDDRRNWDSYRVNGEVKKLTYKEARKMQGFPEKFKFPVPPTQAMKQLGNSVAVDAIQACGKALVEHMISLENENEENMSDTKNKGEWTELLSFMKLMYEEKLFLSDKYLNPTSNFFNVTKLTTHNIDYDCHLNKDLLILKNKKSSQQKTITKSSIINKNLIETLTEKISISSGTFEIAAFKFIEEQLGFTMIKGGTSSQKADILLDINNNEFSKENEGFGIKSYLGSKPTLLNASGNTNFIFKIEGFNKSDIDKVNSIDTRTKIKDRLGKIQELGGKLRYYRTERESLDYNLKLVDSNMPIIIGEMLYHFYINRSSNLLENLKRIHKLGDLNKRINYGDLNSLIVKIKNLLVAVLLGFFPGEKWDGNNESNGTIVIKSNGDQLCFHIVELSTLKDYLFDNIKFDTPSTTRHRFASVILENDREVYFKLNLQLRF